jgi:hypothetical protein
MHPFERYQRDLIALEYERRGYEVDLEGRILGMPYTFDMIARRAGASPPLVFIEMVSAERTLAQVERRRESLAAVARAFPEAAVDLRVVDPSVGAWVARGRSQLAPSPDLPSLLSAYSGDRAGGLDIDVSLVVLQVWTVHAATLRAFYAAVIRAPSPPTDLQDVLELYNELLKRELLVPPEREAEGVSLDLFQLYAVVIGVIQGVPANLDEMEQMQSHLFSVRRQIVEQLPQLGS